MERELAALVHELKRRRRMGESSIYLSDPSHDWLLKKAEALRKLQAEEVARSRQANSSDAARLENSLSAEISTTKKARSGRQKDEASVPDPPEVKVEADAADAWDILETSLNTDDWCLSQLKPGKKLVIGKGLRTAELCFCGEAPGAEEEEQGIPFVGPAGQLLTKMIGAMGLSREQVYISNIMKYRPPLPTLMGNRPPTAPEMAYCLPYLKAELALVKPKIIVALGKTAIDGLLGPDSKRRMGLIRGKWQDWNGIPLMPTYHPSYLLRNQDLAVKRQVWEDLLLVMERLDLPISEKQRGFFR